MKRLLCILDSLNAGGAETFLMKISRSIPAEQYQFDFVVSKDGGVYSQEILNRGGKIYEVPPRRKDFWKAFWSIRSIVKNNKYEYVLKLGDAPIVGLDLLAAKMGGAKCLAFRSCNALTGLSIKGKIADFVMRPVLNKIANVKLAPSVLAAEYTFGKRQSTNVHILHNGVDLRIYHFDYEGRSKIREEFAIKDKLVVGHIGRFNKQKNHEYLLKVFYEIRKQCPDAVLMLVGIGELEEPVRKRIKELELEPYVVFTGLRFDIPQLLSAMDVFVFPSFHEGLPNTVIEAQSTGLPCVISDAITKEVNITGLINYMPLDIAPIEWAKTALEVSDALRRDAAEEFRENGFDIESVSREFLTILGLGE